MQLWLIDYFYIIAGFLFLLAGALYEMAEISIWLIPGEQAHGACCPSVLSLDDCPYYFCCTSCSGITLAVCAALVFCVHLCTTGACAVHSATMYLPLSPKSVCG